VACSQTAHRAASSYPRKLSPLDVIYRGPEMIGELRMLKRLMCALWTCILWSELTVS